MGTGVSSNPSTRIVTQIAAADDLEPTDLEPPLHAVVDPDALDRLIESGRTDVSVTFTYRGHRVRVDGTGDVDVTPSRQFTDANGESTEESHGD